MELGCTVQAWDGNMYRPGQYVGTIEKPGQHFGKRLVRFRSLRVDEETGSYEFRWGRPVRVSPDSVRVVHGVAPADPPERTKVEEVTSSTLVPTAPLERIKVQGVKYVVHEGDVVVREDGLELGDREARDVMYKVRARRNWRAKHGG